MTFSKALLLVLFSFLFACKKDLKSTEQQLAQGAMDSISESSGDQFSVFLKKFKHQELPYYFTLTSLRSMTEFVRVGSAWVPSGYPKLVSGDLQILRVPEATIPTGWRKYYTAYFSFVPKSDIVVVLYGKKIETDDDHNPGGGNWFTLASFNEGHVLVDTLTFAGTLDFYYEQYGCFLQDLSVKTIRFDYVNEASGLMLVETATKFNITPDGHFQKARTWSRKEKYRRIIDGDEYLPMYDSVR